MPSGTSGVLDCAVPLLGIILFLIILYCNYSIILLYYKTELYSIMFLKYMLGHGRIAYEYMEETQKEKKNNKKTGGSFLETESAQNR